MGRSKYLVLNVTQHDHPLTEPSPRPRDNDVTHSSALPVAHLAAVSGPDAAAIGSTHAPAIVASDAPTLQPSPLPTLQPTAALPTLQPLTCWISFPIVGLTTISSVQINAIIADPPAQL